MLRRTSTILASLALASSAATLAACDPAIDDRPIKTLSLAELNDSCTARVQATSDDDLRGFAHLICVSLDNSDEECKPAALAECTEGFYNNLRANFRCDFAPEVYAQAQTCAVSNETLLDCIGGYYTILGSAYGEATCENLDSLPEPSLPEACRTLAAECPGLAIETLEDQGTTRPANEAP
jgi:hypothetical protein